MMVPARDASADVGTPDIQTGEKSIATIATLWYVLSLVFQCQCLTPPQID